MNFNHKPEKVIRHSALLKLKFLPLGMTSSNAFWPAYKSAKFRDVLWFWRNTGRNCGCGVDFLQ